MNSGPERATRYLQRVVGTEEDGILGQHTLDALAARDAREVNNLLALNRARFVVKVACNDPSQLWALRGWHDRALSFYL